MPSYSKSEPVSFAGIHPFLMRGLAFKHTNQVFPDTIL